MQSVLNDQPIPLDIRAVRKGLGWAQSWTNGSILVRIRHQRIQFIATSEQQFLASWSWSLPGVHASCFFLIPPFVATAICNPIAYDANYLAVMVRKNVAGIVMRQGKQEFRLQWRWEPSTFQAPPTFEQMLQAPPPAMQSSYVSIADIVHLAIANLGNMMDNQDFTFEDAAIQIDFAEQRYAFSPRLVIRGMEVARGHQVGFSMQPLNASRALLYFATQREDCQVHCAILSLGPIAQSLPTTTLVIQETRPPMLDGAWVLPRK